MDLNIMKETTLKKVLGKLQLQNALLASIAGAKPGTITISNWSDVSDIVRSGLAPKIFSPAGGQIICPWTDTATGTTYDWVWDIVHMADVELEDGSIVPGMYLQAHYLTPFGIQFDAPENQVATEETFLEDYCYYTKNADGSFTLQDVVTGDAIPADTVYYHTVIKDPTGNICRYGYNRWSHSAYRQWLNSDAEKNQWWTEQHLGDIAPGELRTKDGFLRGFEDDFLSVIKKTKVRTALNTITDAEIGTHEDTYDLMFLASKEQVYGVPENGVSEGDAWDYYKEVTGLSAPNNGNNIGRIKYKLESPTTADWHRLRSPYRGNSYSAWNVSYAGGLNGNNASYSIRSAPACVIA